MFGLFKSKRQTKGSKILVVDDEPDYVSTVECRLGWCGYKVITAANGKEGLEKAESERPDLILLDTSMPVMNGHEMLERLRKSPELKDIPVIMTTALCDVEHISTASSYGIAGYVAKPFDFAVLTDKITEVLEEQRTLSKA
jgi:CheY-like chemotaxis protein